MTTNNWRALARRAWRWFLAAIGAAVGGVIVYAVFVNPLPSDEEMIYNFRTHRADMEALVKRYREYQLPPGEKPRYWAATPETEVLLQRAGIRYVGHTVTLWFPNPYSIDTANRVDAMVRVKQKFDIFRQHGALYLRPAGDRYFIKSWRYPRGIWKDFYEIPEVPKIDNGTVLGPMNVNGESARYRLLASLDGYPDSWKPGECVMRQIEARWFINMCRAA